MVKAAGPGRLPNRQDWRAEFTRLEGVYAPATIKSYVTDVGLFVAWCAAHKLEALPASVEVVCTFLEDQGVALCPSSVQRRLYAIRKVHRLLDLPDPTRCEAVQITLRRVKRSKLNRPKQAKGMTRDYLDPCLAAQPDTPWGLRNRAMISLGYDLLARRSELVALMKDDVTFRPDGTLRVLIRRSKSDPFGLGRLAFSSQRSAALVQAWLDWRGPYIEPLFCAIYHGRPINRALGTTQVKDMIKHSAQAAGLPPEDVAAFSSHSLRVGAAQDLLCAGYDTAAIMRAGGWKSLEVLGRYLEFAEHNVWA
jgi:integrase/recombinase XerD